MTLSLRTFGLVSSAIAMFALPWAVDVGAQQNAPVASASLAQRIAHTNPNGYGAGRGAVHAGAGTMGFGALFNGGVFGPHFNFMHRGEIRPGAGIGHHFHNTADEMFVILNGEAQFTIDGRTALVKGPVGVVCRAGHSHAIYNSSNEVLQWINFNVSVTPGISDAFDLGDDRVGAALDRVPTFVTTRLDRALFTAGRGGRGGAAASGAEPAAAPQPVMTRRAGAPTIFASPWSYVDHMLIQPGASTPAMAHDSIAEAYYVMAGSGTVTVGTESAPFTKGDAIPVRLGDTSSFKNTGTEPLELLVYGVAKDMESKIAMMTSGRRGAPGGPGGFGAPGGRSGQ
jgi:mannose-6-phosphate isomerase-like protein (cupin superfamily)